MKENLTSRRHGPAALPVAPITPASDRHGPPDNRLRCNLWRALNGLSFPAFAALAQEMLKRSGYQKVVLAGRLSPRGRILHGGCDLLAYTATDLETVQTAVQLKQYRQLVGRRFVDELRGAMLRLGAEQGLLITTSAFSPAVRRIAETGEVAPVRLVDGQELIDILLQNRIGLQERDGRWQVDREYFKGLGRNAPVPVRPTHPTGAAAAATTASAALTQSTVNSGAATGRGRKKGGGMTWPTHVMVGLNTLWLFEVLPRAVDPMNFGLLAAAAALGALLPDLDASESKIKYLQVSGIRPFYLPAQLLHQQLGHRGLLHSLVGLGLVALLALPLALWLGWSVPLALLLGYASHLAADACTRSGIPLLYPRKRRIHLLPRPLRFVTGSPAEDALFAVCALTVMWLLLLQLAAANPLP